MALAYSPTPIGGRLTQPGRRRLARYTAVAVMDMETEQGPPSRRVALFVEPSPFSHTSGMKNRFLNLISNLTAQGDEVRPAAPPLPAGAHACADDAHTDGSPARRAAWRARGKPGIPPRHLLSFLPLTLRLNRCWCSLPVLTRRSATAARR